jgi:hypothetical protein
MRLPPAGAAPPNTSARPTSSFSQPLSVPSATAVDSSSNCANPRPKKSSKSTHATSSTGKKRRRDALDDGYEDRSTAKSSFVSSDIPTPAISTLKASNAASMITLAGAVASLGTSINHQTMTSDHHVADKVQGFVNSQKYLSNYEKSVLGEYYAVQTNLASGLMKMDPPVAKLTLLRKFKFLTKDEPVQVPVDEELENMSGMSVSDD